MNVGTKRGRKKIFVYLKRKKKGVFSFSPILGICQCLQDTWAHLALAKRYRKIMFSLTERTYYCSMLIEEIPCNATSLPESRDTVSDMHRHLHFVALFCGLVRLVAITPAFPRKLTSPFTCLPGHTCPFKVWVSSSACPQFSGSGMRCEPGDPAITKLRSTASGSPRHCLRLR
jgi:hypothetical protein